MARPIVKRALEIPPALTIAITAASMHQAVTSSAAAQVMASAPRGVFVRFRSLIIRARTGNAVILIAMPMNREKEMNLTPSGASS